jgi:mercuric ion binding protein
MNCVKLLSALGLFVLFGFPAAAQSPGMVKKSAAPAAAALKTEVFAVLGNCGMCQKTIQTAAVGAGARQADWDMDAKKLTVVFDPAVTSVDAIQKAVSLAGYDNAGYRAPDAVYENLHGCCQYERQN